MPNHLNTSKIYRYPLGHVAFQTATVKDMIEFLSQFPANTALLATWESVVRPIGDFEFLERFSYMDNDESPALFFDVE